jgi:hypothetical protein
MERVWEARSGGESRGEGCMACFLGGVGVTVSESTHWQGQNGLP